jgi:opacity protein-like surface antigen
MTIRATLVCLLVLIGLIPAATLAEVSNRYGPYLSLSGGPTVPSGGFGFNPDNTTTPTIPTADFDVNDGYAVIGAAGIYIDAWRGEIELSYRANDLTNASIDGVPPIASSSGDFSALSFMANAYYDLPIIQDHLNLYIGGGAGVASLSMNASATDIAGTHYSLDASNAAFALQFMAGLDAPITKRIHLTFGYRLWTALGASFTFSSNTGNSNITAHGNGTFDTPLLHSLELGLRIDL